MWTEWCDGSAWFFDLSRRSEGLDAKGDPLATLSSLISWELFRPKLLTALRAQKLRRPAGERRGAAGRKPWDEVLIFEALVVQALYNLSDEETEYRLRDRLSFMRLVGLGLEDAVPDATTLWLYREALASEGAVETLFAEFDAPLRGHGFMARGGQIIEQPSWRPRASATAARRTPPPRQARRRRSGAPSPPRRARRMSMHAGPRSMAARTTATSSRVRARVEHVFGHQANAMGAKLVRTIGLVRARMKIGMQNLAYDMSRFAALHRMAASST